MEENGNELTMHDIYSPVDSYRTNYRQQHNESTISLFDEMVEKSQIDIEANRATNKKISDNNGQTSNTNKSIKRRKNLKTFAIVLLIISIIAIVVSVVQIQTVYNVSMYIGIIVLAVAFIILSILIIKKAKERLSELGNVKDKLLEISKKLHSEADEQMLPLNRLLLKNYNTELFSKTIPLVKFDKMFDSKRLDYMTGKFGLNAAQHAQNIEQSTLFVQSGEIKGNPFFIREKLQHTMGTKTYQGSLTIHWSTTERDSNGNRRTVNHSDTLYANVNKPCPYYANSSHLVYGNEVGDKLSFSREPSNVQELKERKLEKLIAKRSKEIQKLSEKSTKKGGTFTALGNNQFDALFYAKDRDNESQFRLLFTPLAQQELIKMIKDSEVGFGDDFAFLKRKMINFIYPDHLKNSKLNVKDDYFTGIDYDKVRSRFIDYHNSYFKHIFFTFAPIFAVPLYTQHQTQEYIYKDLYDSNVSFYEHEMVANCIDIDEIKPAGLVTYNIIKTSLESSQDNVDALNVHVWGYRTEERVDYISKYGGDGRWHKVPVYWTEYIAVDKKSRVEVKVAKNGESSNAEQATESWDRVGNILARIVK
ncbi:MAG1210 family protein [Labilibaculum sp.]|uniref:MAG1210 family protein n=1 Tax=Labilibaculum sp. TaxID=2060723 RepID=UPI003568E510